MTRQALVETISQAIATKEGFFITEAQALARGQRFPTVAQRCNNPGNLRSWGKTPTENGYASFANLEAGWGALKTQIGKNIDRGLTFLEFFGGKPKVYGGYAPAADKNDPKAYAEFVAKKAGSSAGTVIKELIG